MTRVHVRYCFFLFILSLNLHSQAPTTEFPRYFNSPQFRNLDWDNRLRRYPYLHNSVVSNDPYPTLRLFVDSPFPVENPNDRFRTSLTNNYSWDSLAAEIDLEDQVHDWVKRVNLEKSPEFRKNLGQQFGAIQMALSALNLGDPFHRQYAFDRKRDGITELTYFSDTKSARDAYNKFMNAIGLNDIQIPDSIDNPEAISLWTRRHFNHGSSIMSSYEKIPELNKRIQLATLEAIKNGKLDGLFGGISFKNTIGFLIHYKNIADANLSASSLRGTAGDYFHNRTPHCADFLN